MKIIITNEGEYYNIYKENDRYPLMNQRTKPFVLQYAFYDEDIENLIGEKHFANSWLKGKCEYRVSLNHLELITGKRSAANKDELEMYKD